MVVKGGVVEQNGKRTHGHGQQCGDWWGKQSIKELMIMEKNKIKII